MKSRSRGGGPCRASRQAHGALVPGRGADRADEQAHPQVGEARQPCRSALAHPIHRPTRLGGRVLINARRYQRSVRANCGCGGSGNRPMYRSDRGGGEAIMEWRQLRLAVLSACCLPPLAARTGHPTLSVSGAELSGSGPWRGQQRRRRERAERRSIPKRPSGMSLYKR